MNKIKRALVLLMALGMTLALIPFTGVFAEEVAVPAAADIIYGDVDGNGVVAIGDAALIQQYIAGYDVTLNEAAADVDGNGVVAIGDAALIQQYIAGYDVTLGPDEPDEPIIWNDAELNWD